MVNWDALVLGPVVAQFGEPVTYSIGAQAPVPITGVFDEQYTEVDLADGQPVTSAMPVLGVQLSQFPAPPQQGDTLFIQRTAETFVVKEVRPDGHGAAKLMLNLAS